jgi:electron transfer flavoprotein beta subunit
MSLRICVCVKIVPRAVAPLRLDPATLRLDRSGPSELNPADLFAVEEALQLREREGGEVRLLSVAPAEGIESLRPALAMGADRATLVADLALVGSDLLGTSAALAAAVARDGADMVLFGAGSVDGVGALLWAAVAERLGWPVLSGVRSVELAEGVARSVRQVVGADQGLEAPLPCVIAISGSPSTPRYPSFRDIVGAKRKTIEVLGLADLGVAPGAVGAAAARTEVLALGMPPRRAGGEIVDDPAAAVPFLERVLAALGLP